MKPSNVLIILSDEHLDDDFATIYDRIASQPEIKPGMVLPSDRVYSVGSGQYHAQKRQGVPA